LTGGQGRSTAQSTGVYDVHGKGPVDRPVDRGEEWSTARSTDWKMAALGWCRPTGPVDRG